jgi:hypothetical protein
MKIRIGSIVLLAVFFALTMSMTAFATEPCGLANEIYCQGQDLTGTLYASQNDTNIGGFGNFATAYDHFTLAKTWDVESFHWVGGYFGGGQAPITAWTLTFYNNNGGIPGGAIMTDNVAGNANETLLANGLYQYDLFFKSFNMGPGTYWASVVPDIGFPPQWGQASSGTGDGMAYQCFFGACGQIGGVNLAFALDGTSGTTTPEPGTMVMLGTGILGLAGMLRRKLL